MVAAAGTAFILTLLSNISASRKLTGGQA